MNTFKIKSIGIGKDKLFIELSPFKIITIPKNYTKKLKEASIKDLEEYEIIGDGIGIHFSKINEDIGVEGIIRDFLKEKIEVPFSIYEKLNNLSKKYNLPKEKILENALERL